MCFAKIFSNSGREIGEKPLLSFKIFSNFPLHGCSQNQDPTLLLPRRGFHCHPYPSSTIFQHKLSSNPQSETPISFYFPNCPPSLPLRFSRPLLQKIHVSLFFFIAFIARYSHKTHLQNLHSFKN
ncbi:hypothetical protein OIU78_025112 [Salix suchowensis]|nr:hypothetical protein OIU78_025112 [Salix suchowensis]